MRAITPIQNLGKPASVAKLRLYEAPGGIARPLGHFRATSPDKNVLAPVAEAYETPLVPWKPGPKKADSDHKWAVDLPPRIRVILFGAVSDIIREDYQVWNQTNQRFDRRCDGVTASVPGGPGVGGLKETPCVCREEGAVLCKPSATLWVSLPEATTTGLFVVSTSTYKAVGYLSKAVAACKTAAAGAPVADAWLSIGSDTTSYYDQRGKPQNGRVSYPELEPVAGDLSVGELRELAAQRQQAAAELSYDGWGARVQIGQGQPQITPASEPVPAPTRAHAPATQTNNDDDVIDAHVVPTLEDLRATARQHKVSVAALTKKAIELFEVQTLDEIRDDAPRLAAMAEWLDTAT